MKKLLLGLFAGCMALGASAQSVTPSPGVLNLDDGPGGIGTITVNGDWKPNRNCAEMATLSHNGLVIKMVPASNVPNVYCIEGFDKVEHGNVTIEFYKGTDSPATQFGNFVVRIPAGYLIDMEDGSLSPEIVRDYQINVVTGAVTPANGSAVDQIENVYITFPEGTKITFADPSKPFFSTSESIDTGKVDEDGDPIFEAVDVYPTSIDFQEGSRVAVLRFPAITCAGRNQLEVPAGTFKVESTIPGLTGEYGNLLFGASYYISDKNAQFTINPANGTFEGGIPSFVAATDFSLGSWDTPGDLYGNFVITSRPEDPDFGSVMGVKFSEILEDGSLKDATNLTVKRVDGHTLVLYPVAADDVHAPYFLTAAPGKYTVNVPKNKFYFGYTPVPAFTIGEYNITAAPAKDFIVTPSTEEELTEISEIRAIFPEGTALTWKSSEYATLTNELGTATYMFKGTVEDNAVVFQLSAPVTLPGIWKLATPNGALTVNGNPSLIAEQFKIAEVAKLPVEVNIPNGEETKVEFIEDEEWGQVLEIYTKAIEGEDLVNITFEIPAGYDKMLYLNYGSQGSRLFKTTVDDLLEAGFEEGNVISVAPGTKNDLYAIMFANNGVVNDETTYRTLITVDYPTGVKAIENIVNSDVYTITGVKVATNGNIANLPAGLYIINGQKVIIK